MKRAAPAGPRTRRTGYTSGSMRTACFVCLLLVSAFVAAAALVVRWLRAEPSFYLLTLAAAIIGNGASWAFSVVKP